jgi:CheY-like chemotaxis protein
VSAAAASSASSSSAAPTSDRPAASPRRPKTCARPHLILLDQHLPDITGTEVLQRLKADPATRDITVVIVSADATPGQMRKMRELGADDYLTKPLDVRRFLQVIDGIVEDDRSGTATLDGPQTRPGGAPAATQARSRR